MKNHLYLIFLILIILFSCQQQPDKKEAPPPKPNIIFILTDDLGYGDLGVLFQNQRAEAGLPSHKTPRLDQMANEGMLLTRHYVPAPVCAPSRASLLQGVHQGHAQIRDNQFDKALSDNHNLATVLKEAGYTTGLIGKYGLQGREGSNPGTWEAYPTKRGFDYFFGYVRHRDGHNHYPAHEAPDRPPVEFYSGNEEISSQLKGCYTTDLFIAAAKKWITDNTNNSPGQPFFLYLAYDTPHAGLEVASTPYPEGGGLNGGLEWIGEDGNFINTAEEPVNDYIHPDYAEKDWPDTQKRFASIVRRIDNATGDLRQLLIDLNIDENTLIVFSSDNGPHRESYGYGDYDPTLFDSFGPFDGIKRDTWEGGIRMPTFARWPGHIPSNTSNNTPTQFHDWLSTFSELAGLPAPGRSDGVSLVPLLMGNDDQVKSKVYVEYFEGRPTPEYEEFHPSHAGQLRRQMQVVYLDGYKGVRYDIDSWSDNFRIYDTSEDQGETNDLAGSNDYFTDLQERMKKEVIRLRRPDTTAVRPYDRVPVPAHSITGLEKGLRYQVYETSTPWVPDIGTLKKDPVETGTVENFDPDVRTRDNQIVILYTGLLEAPETGKYSLSLKMNGKGVLRIHKATVIDADKLYDPGTFLTTDIHLEKGFHPIQFTFCNMEETNPSIQLELSGPGFSMQPLDPALLTHTMDDEIIEMIY